MISIILPVKNENTSAEFFINVFKNYIKFENELVFVYDHENDNTIDIIKYYQKKYKDIKLVKNNYAGGAMYAAITGVEKAKYEIVMICTVDELFFIHKIEEMLNKINIEKFEFVSATRYSKGGKRYGGSMIGSILSGLSNKTFRILTNFPLSDISTGFKMFNKNLLLNYNFFSRPIGWSFAVEISILAYLKNLKMCEVPIISLDRTVGGSSTFTGKKIIWIKEYLRIFLWALSKVLLSKKNDK